MPSINLIGVPSRDVPSVWPFVEKWIVELCGKLPDAPCNGELFHECSNAEKQLWLAVDGKTPIACMITGIKEGGEVHIFLATGERLTDWAHLFHEFKQLTKAAGFKTISSFSRKGWLKALKTTNARVRRIEMVWDL
jgi:hypothetical protein